MALVDFKAENCLVIIALLIIDRKNKNKFNTATLGPGSGLIHPIECKF